MNFIKGFAAPKKKETTGPLTGRIIDVGAHHTNLKVESVLGEGGFATIYRVVNLHTQSTHALKHFVLSGDAEAERDVLTEIAVMNSLRECPHTLNLLAYTMTTTDAFLLLDLCEKSLAAYVASLALDPGSRGNPRGSLSLATALGIFLPVAQAVATMHALEPPLSHRDIKAENVLCLAPPSSNAPGGGGGGGGGGIRDDTVLHTDHNNTSTNNTKMFHSVPPSINRPWVLCDFGSASSVHKIYNTAVEISREEERIRKHTTPAYRAPELWDLFERKHIGLPADIWSLGCLLYFLMYLRLPFDGEAKLQILNGVFSFPRWQGDAGEGQQQSIECLIQDMLVVDPMKRISADEVVARCIAIMINTEECGGVYNGGSEQKMLPSDTKPEETSYSSNHATTTTMRSSSSMKNTSSTAVASTKNASVPPAVEYAEWGAEFQHIGQAHPTFAIAASQQDANVDPGWADFDATTPHHATAAIDTSVVASAPSQRTNITIHAKKTEVTTDPGTAIHVSHHAQSRSPPSVKKEQCHTSQGNNKEVEDEKERHLLRERCSMLEQTIQLRNKEIVSLQQQLALHISEIKTLKRQIDEGRNANASLRKSVHDVQRQPSMERSRSGSDVLASFPLSLDSPEKSNSEAVRTNSNDGGGGGNGGGGGASGNGNAIRRSGSSSATASLPMTRQRQCRRMGSTLMATQGGLSSSPSKRPSTVTEFVEGGGTAFQDLDPLG